MSQLPETEIKQVIRALEGAIDYEGLTDRHILNCDDDLTEATLDAVCKWAHEGV